MFQTKNETFNVTIDLIITKKISCKSKLNPFAYFKFLHINWLTKLMGKCSLWTKKQMNGNSNPGFHLIFAWTIFFQMLNNKKKKIEIILFVALFLKKIEFKA